MQVFSGINTFWNLLNNEPITTEIKSLSKINRVDKTMTFVFPILYTKILHNKLSRVISELIDFCFDGGGNAYVAVTKYVPKWISDRSTFPTAFNKKGFKKTVKHLLDNFFLYNWCDNIPVDYKCSYRIRPCKIYG